MKEHRWKLSWPGNFCLDCGLPDPLEDDDILIDCIVCGGGPDKSKDCKSCLGTGCGIKPNLVIPPCGE